MQGRLEALKRKHTELHNRIEVLQAEKAPDIYINKLKKEKLVLKDEITRIENGQYRYSFRQYQTARYYPL